MSKKVKVWQADVDGCDGWTQLAEDDKCSLVVCELYSDFFGYTEVLTPQIADIMKGLGKSANQVLWRRVNVIKLEEEALERAQEKQKSKEEGQSQPISAKVPGLEKFSGFASPQPWFLFMKVKDGKFVLFDILKAANPPVLSEMVSKYMQEDVVPAEGLDFNMILRTNAEIAEEKAAKAADRALTLEIENRIHSIEPEDPGKLTVDEVVKIFKTQFCDENGKFLPNESKKAEEEAGAEEEQAEEPIETIAQGFDGKSTDDVIAFLKTGVTLERLNEVKARKEEIRKKEEEEAEMARLKKAEEEAAAREAELAEQEDEQTVEQTQD